MYDIIVYYVCGISQAQKFSSFYNKLQIYIGWSVTK